MIKLIMIVGVGIALVIGIIVLIYLRILKRLTKDLNLLIDEWIKEVDEWDDKI